MRFSRNNPVKVKYKDGKIIEGKYKKFLIDIENGDAVLIE